MSLVGCVLNEYPSSYDGRFYVASYDNLPKSWDKIGTFNTDYKKLYNDGTPYNFGSYKYLVVVIMPTTTDLFGSAIAFNVPMLMKYASPDNKNDYSANLILHFCTQSNGTFTWNFTNSSGVETTHTISTGDTTSIDADMYVAPNSYSVTSAIYPFVVGTSSGSTVFAQNNASGALQIFTPMDNVVVSLKKTYGFLYILLIILVILIFGVVIAVVIMKYKRKI